MTRDTPALVQFARGDASDMDWVQSVDYLWLQEHADRVFRNLLGEVAAEEPVSPPPEKPESDLRRREPAGRPSPPAIPPKEGLAPPRKSQIPVVPESGFDDFPMRQQPANPLRLQKLITFPGTVEIARALRPLDRRVGSGVATDIDIEATVDATAKACSVFVPVLRQALSRWVAIDLVFDSSASMDFWADLPTDLEEIIEGSGVFRHVRRWGLKTRGAVPRLTNALGAPQNPDLFLSGREDRVVLVVTDNMGPAWHSLEAVRLMESWGRRRSVTVLQLLPPDQWQHTALWQTETARLSSRSTLPANVSRSLLATWPLTLRPPASGVPFPIFNLDADGFTRWAALLCSKGGNAMRGIQFCEHATALASPGQGESLAGNDADAAEKVSAFLRRATSPLTIELATLLAAAPLIPSVMRLIQHTFLKQSCHWHLSAIVFSGLARRSRYAGERLWYEWLPGVQKQLLALVSSRTSVNVWQEAARWLREHEPLYRSFQALYPHPQGMHRANFGDESLYFAQFDAELFKTWGGEWADRGRQIQQALPCGRAVVESILVMDDSVETSVTFHVLWGRVGGDGRVCVKRKGRPVFETRFIFCKTLFEPVQGIVLEGQKGRAELVGTLAGRIAGTFHFELGDEIDCYDGNGPSAPPVKPRLALFIPDMSDWQEWNKVIRDVVGDLFETRTWPSLHEANVAAIFEDQLSIPVIKGMDAALVIMDRNIIEEDRAYPVESAKLSVLLKTLASERASRPFPCVILRAGKIRGEVRSPLRVPLGIRAAGEHDGAIPDDLPAPMELVEPAEVPSAAPRILAALGVLPHETLDRFGITLIQCPPGDFVMGSPDDEPGRSEDEGPQHRVTLTKPFWLGETPVTQQQWREVIEAGVAAVVREAQDLTSEPGVRPSRFKNAGDDAPVEQVSWDDVQKWLGVLNALTTDIRGRDKALGSVEFRLPTEAQWEYACRAGARSALYTGRITIKDERHAPELDIIAWYGGNSTVEYESDWEEKQYPHTSAGTHPVKGKRPNNWGLHDMIGNVWEWCAEGQRTYNAEPVQDPAGPEGDGLPRVVRGGSWLYYARDCRSACRETGPLGDRDFSHGFRVAAVSVEPDEPEKIFSGQPCGRAVVTMPVEGFGGRPWPAVTVIEGKICRRGRVIGRREGRQLCKAVVEEILTEESITESLFEDKTHIVEEVSQGGKCSLLLKPDYRFDSSDEIICWAPEFGKPPEKPRLLFLCDNSMEHMNWKDSGLRQFLADYFQFDDSIFYRVTVDLNHYDAALLMVVRGAEGEAEDFPRVALKRQRDDKWFPACLITKDSSAIKGPPPALPTPLLISSRELSAYDKTRVLAALGVLPRETLKQFELALIQCPAGDFLMGSPEDEVGREKDEGPQHQVTLTKPFWLGETPVTQRQWRDVIEAGMAGGVKEARELSSDPGLRPSRFTNAGEEAPVEEVSWDDAQKWLRVLNTLTKDERRHSKALGGLEFRLPTEAQWEYACRAGTSSAIYTGSITDIGEYYAPELDAIAWYGGNSDVEYQGGFASESWTERRNPHTKAGTHQVKRKRPNDWGLYDMIGNVWELCDDYWGRYGNRDLQDPVRFKGGAHVARGGAWSVRALGCRAAIRLQCSPNYRFLSVGFRVAAVPVEFAEPEASRLEEGARSKQLSSAVADLDDRFAFKNLRLAIFGPGMMGGSLLHDARALEAKEIRVWARRKEPLEAIEALGLSDFTSTDPVSVAKGADFLVLCMPVGAIPSMARLLSAADPAAGSIITDIGSQKGSVMREAAPVFERAGLTFIGSHPMAGSERNGLAAARTGLFRDATCLLTPTPLTSPEALARLHSFWQALGCRTTEMDADLHDAVMARISHLPHVVAVLATIASFRPDPHMARLAAGGLRDTTRIASGDPSIWGEILMENRQALLPVLRELNENAGEILAVLESGDGPKLRAMLDEARLLRATGIYPRK